MSKVISESDYMKKTYVFAGLAILFWSSVATVSKLLLNTLGSYQVLMYSALFAALALFVINLATGKLKLFKEYRFKDYIIMTLIGLPGTFFYYVFYYLGTARMSASQAFIINYLWPIMSVVFACILLGEKLTVRKCIAFVLSFLGVLTVAGEDILNFNAQSLIGIGLCAIAAVSYGLFTALGRKWKYDDGNSLMLSCLSSAFLSFLINIFSGGSFVAKPLEILGFAWNGVFVMAIATFLWALALRSGGTAKVSNLAYITPFLSLVWTRLILDEPIKPLSVVGLVIIVVGIFIQMGPSKKKIK